MAQQRVEYPERFALERRIGNYHFLPKPVGLLGNAWGAREQADAILTAMRVSIRSGHVRDIYFSDGSSAGAVKMNRSYLPSRLHEPFHHATLALGAKILACETVIAPHSVSFHKLHGRMSWVFGPDFLIHVPDIDTAKKLMEKLSPPKLG